MDLIEIDVVRLQTLQRIFAGANDIKTGMSMVVRPELCRIVYAEAWPTLTVIHFSRNQYLVPPAVLFDGLTNDLFAAAVGISIAGIDKIDSGLQRHIQNSC